MEQGTTDVQDFARSAPDGMPCAVDFTGAESVKRERLLPGGR